MSHDFLAIPKVFRHPEPVLHKSPILSIFLTFSGCPVRCVYCAQQEQTGHCIAPVHERLKEAENRLEDRARLGMPPAEPAFFGGTFTALPKSDRDLCLEALGKWHAKGLAVGGRCSTRPDSVDAEKLLCLKEAGFSCVELGIQSFSDAALAASSRGYSGETAGNACRLVRESGLTLGIQLMPGMPGLDIETARRDVAEAVSQTPAFARLYPCLVIEGSPLAALWRKGRYIPWSLEDTVPFLAEACLALWDNGIAVIRMGLAPEAGLREAILAGPDHPSIGGSARAKALLLIVRRAMREAGISEGTPCSLAVPKRRQGELWGHKRTLASEYAALGIAPERVLFRDGEDFELSSAFPPLL